MNMLIVNTVSPLQLLQRVVAGCGELLRTDPDMSSSASNGINALIDTHTLLLKHHSAARSFNYCLCSQH